MSSASTARGLIALSALCAFVSLAGCKSIVGIKDRHFDPTLVDAGGLGGKSGGKAGSGSGGRADAGSLPHSGSGGSGGKDAGSDAMSDGGDAMTPADPCELYCSTVMDNCTDQYAVYASPQICMAVCAKLPMGDMGDADPIGNSVACRLNQARLAGLTREPEDHCPRSGPGGAGVCGENCESFCMLDSLFCPETEDPDCLTKCPALRDLDDEKRNFDDSTFDVVKHHDGDYLQCRLVHVSSASIAPLAHCWHTALAPLDNKETMETNPCADPPTSVPRCEDYCRLNTTICTDALAQYESIEQCVKLCASFDPGMSGDPGGQNTLGCRKSHSYNALLGGPDTHCPHSGPGGHSVCGSNCESYCNEVKAACKTPFATKFPDNAACISECEGLADHDDAYTIAAGKSAKKKFACRLLQTERAFEDPDACTAALGGGSCQ